MKSSSLLLLAGVGVAAFFLIKKKAGSMKKSLLTTWGVKSLKLSGTNVVAVVSVVNPSRVPQKLNSFTGGLFTGTTQIATIKNFQPVTLKVNGESQISVTFVPKGFGIFQGLKDLVLGNKKGKKKFTIVGNADLNGVKLPVRIAL